jgi:hypothetical protein
MKEGPALQNNSKIIYMRNDGWKFGITMIVSSLKNWNYVPESRLILYS